MGSDGAYLSGGLAHLAPAAVWDRFASWPRRRALAALVALVLMLAASAIVPLTVGRGEIAKPAHLPTLGATSQQAERPRDDDLTLYDHAIARIRHGENYYDFIAQEHRQAHYPLRPGLAVRLPTLAYLCAAMGVDEAAPAPFAIAASIALMLAVIWAWRQRLTEEACSDSQRLFGTALIFLGASLGLNRYYFVLHELWAGMLIALSLGLHRPTRNRWLGAWLAAALALSIRELVLPYVLLMGAMALWRGNRREAAAWGGLVAVFLAGMAVHLHLIAQHTLPTDPVGPSWFALRGLGGWLSNVVLASNLRFLPHWIAGPIVIAMILGWAGWRSEAGATATLLFLGYGLLFMIAGRDDNFYWGAVIAPAMFVGLAFAPMALQGVWQAVWTGREGV
ncbi:hypothetical protein [Novosphingobium terrae]|uniref:hypothetical protein n=1 Tax=Novosphingobium terrae TaxID=2726189 RepID=UPI001F141DDA|nr:hypothetical protein [Novosphingobium terrae]